MNEIPVEQGKSVIVAVRIRPLSASETEAGVQSCVSTLSDQVVAIKKGQTHGGYLKSQKGSLSEYAFDAVFDENALQKEVYNKTTKPYLTNLLVGLNVTVFAYGATGAGKTHTMMGNFRADDEVAGKTEAGIIPNALVDLFAMIKDKKASCGHGEEYSILVSFIEVYNEQVYDLLENSGKILQLREDQEKGVVVVAGVTERSAEDPDTVLDFLSEGNLNRKTEATLANQVSSRSHAVLQITLRHSRKNEAGRTIVTESKLSLIDLAGSERASATNNRGVRLQEGANINKSLLALANCINALAGDKTKKNNVKYRDSKLTHLLKSSLEGNCNLIMIANINPSDTTYEDSHNTLKYSNRAKNIKVNPVALEQSKESNWIEREAVLRSENAYLRQKVIDLEEEVRKLREEKGASVEVSSSSSGVVSTAMARKRDSLDGLASDLGCMDVIDEAFEGEEDEDRLVESSGRYADEGINAVEEAMSNKEQTPPTPTPAPASAGKQITIEMVSEEEAEEEAEIEVIEASGDIESHHEQSWGDLGLSDSILANGLFSEEMLSPPALALLRRSSKKQSRGEKELEEAVIRSKEKNSKNKAEKSSSPAAAARPTKKRRESFLPQPSSRRQSVSAGDLNANISVEPKKHKFLKRRLSMGPAAFVHKDAKISVDPPKRRSSRLSMGPNPIENDQENTAPQQSSIISKGMKIISSVMKGDSKNAICPEIDQMNDKSASKAKSNQETRALALRASNRRKSLAIVSKTLQEVGEFEL